jgi:7,8-dihydropterin-6-yl-methyl-4-(beta-D-ribofuranosyl)aminobenzene 5'-phosphate synthase
MNELKRRDFLKSSAAFAAASAAGGFSCVEIASAAPIEVPTIDRLTARVLIDQNHDQFMQNSTVNGVLHEAPGAARSPDARNTLHNQWGLSLYLESQREQEQRAVMVDFGYTAAALSNNMGILKVDPSKVQALIVSHGHIDHYGGLIGFLQQYRKLLPPDIKLYAGGEDNFCHRMRGGNPGQLSEGGTLDRADITAQNVTTVLCETSTVIGHAFTTGKIKRNSMERILPNGFVDYTPQDGGIAGQVRARRARA